MNINPAMIQQFINFQQSFRGNPQQMVQQMLSSGRISQQQYQNAVQMAQQLQGMLSPIGTGGFNINNFNGGNNNGYYR